MQVRRTRKVSLCSMMMLMSMEIITSRSFPIWSLGWLKSIGYPIRGREMSNMLFPIKLSSCFLNTN